ncbi:hypothetical protein [Burkholderia vietnamiensis]|uniref:hypothetical protein n=1 Tax=Burkholderia vietnamiensis TaxID=60552 RepID=UPI000756AC5B|nr:hypothetical protein [Burkholderia vietnamiensis]KVF27008.1 hypothetical protein WJ08_26015 [Burkholderia vietnamiensis]KVF39672.1 hypothetical protein WJ10_20380 [Burkholderia vietnamiensis]HDR9241418.1 hypothetical protein [Burkholderia vietnamiensis]
MSSSDYLDGMAFAQARARRAQAGARATVAEWKAYADDLLAKLRVAEIAALKNGAQLAGRQVQQQELRKALAALDPTHKLLPALPQIGNAAVCDYLDAHGYDYDVTSGEMTPKAGRRFGV